MYRIKVNIANRANYGAKRPLKNIQYIVIHYTGNDGDHDGSNGNYFRKNAVKASAHYFVDDDSATQSVPEDYTAYSVGGAKYASCAKTGGGKMYKKCTNANSISVELCDTVRNGKVYPSDATVANALELTRSIMKRYGIPADRVIRHFDVNGKSCPTYWCGTSYKDKLWLAAFKSKLSYDPTYDAVFDSDYYATKYADLKTAFGTDRVALLNHFITCGMREGRQASAEFNVQAYKARYADLMATFGRDLRQYYLHYINFGKKEGRTGI